MKFDDKTFVLGIGAQKGGTSWLYKYLSGRDDIYMSPVKEMHYFDVKYRPDICGPIEAGLNRKLKRMVEKAKEQKKQRERKKMDALRARIDIGHDNTVYKEFFRSRVPEDVNFFGEITPSYSLVPEKGFREIRALFPSIRVIFIMRDPVERFLSQVRMDQNSRQRKNGDARDIVDFIKFHLENRGSVERSSYQNVIANVDNAFESHEVIYLFYETLFRKETIQSLCNSIGLEYLEADFGRVVNSTGPREPVPADIWGKARMLFDPTYKFCRERFGDALPKEWNI